MSVLSQLKTEFPHLAWQAEAPLASHTYMRVGGPAEVLWVAEKIDDFVNVIRFAQQEQIPYTILGGASNVVVRDRGIAGLVIVNHCSRGEHFATQAELQAVLPLANEWFISVPPQAQFIVAEAGTPTALLVGQAAQHQLTGLEPFVGVPGTFGGAIFNNSHYQKELIGDWIVAIEILNADGGRQWIPQAEAEFGYDSSRFQHSGEIILQAVVFAVPGTAEVIQAKLRESTQKRAGTQPLGTANSGCVFKNVTLTAQQAQQYDGKTTLPAGWLIDQCGLKGTRVGDAEVSPVHANFIVNTGHATTADIEQLITLIQEKVHAQFGVELEREVFFLGKEQ